MKKLHAALIVLAFPLSLAAQTPAGPIDMTAVFRNRTMNLQRQLAQAFDSIPESKFGYKPTPAQLTIGYIAQHLASDNYFFCNNFGAMRGTPAPIDSATKDSEKAMWPKDTLVTKLKASFAFCESAFAQLSDAKLAETIAVPGPNGTTRQVPRVQYVFGHAMDMQDHYSQLANYMRLNGMLPPSALPRPKQPGN